MIKKGLKSFKKLFEQIVRLFLPFSCHLCGSNTNLGKVVCKKCIRALNKSFKDGYEINNTGMKTRLFTLSYYVMKVADAIRVIKYRPSERLLYQVLENCCRDKKIKIISPDTILVPVPMHKKRQAERGFNQAQIITRYLSDVFGCKYSAVVERTVNTRPQADCDRLERLVNLNGAFRLHPLVDRKAFDNKKIVIVDDVATTGTTIDKVAEIIGQLNPSSVSAVVLSHSFRRSKNKTQTKASK